MVATRITRVFPEIAQRVLWATISIPLALFNTGLDARRCACFTAPKKNAGIGIGSECWSADIYLCDHFISPVIILACAR